MIKYSLTQDNKYTHFRVQGHAGYKTEEKEFDIVCGLVSALAQTALYGCAKYNKTTKATLDHTQCRDGLLTFYFPKSCKEANAIADAAIYGIEQVKEQFPQCFE